MKNCNKCIHKIYAYRAQILLRTYFSAYQTTNCYKVETVMQYKPFTVNLLYSKMKYHMLIQPFGCMYDNKYMYEIRQPKGAISKIDHIWCSVCILNLNAFSVFSFPLVQHMIKQILLF